MYAFIDGFNLYHAIDELKLSAPQVARPMGIGRTVRFQANAEIGEGLPLLVTYYMETRIVPETEDILQGSSGQRSRDSTG